MKGSDIWIPTFAVNGGLHTLVAFGEPGILPIPVSPTSKLQTEEKFSHGVVTTTTSPTDSAKVNDTTQQKIKEKFTSKKSMIRPRLELGTFSALGLRNPSVNET